MAKKRGWYTEAKRAHGSLETTQFKMLAALPQPLASVGAANGTLEITISNDTPRVTSMINKFLGKGTKEEDSFHTVNTRVFNCQCL